MATLTATMSAATATAVASVTESPFPVPNNLFHGSVTLMLIEILITIVGLTIQLCNVVYALRHAITLRTTINVFLVVTMILYALAFVPLLLNSGLGSVSSKYAIYGQEEVAIRDALVNSLNQAHSMIFSIATLLYILIVQFRFRVIKQMMAYPAIIDTVFVTTTVVLWFINALIFGTFGSTLWPNMITPARQLQFFAVWSVYGLLVDTVLSFIFTVKLFNIRRSVFREAQRDPATRTTITPEDILEEQRVLQRMDMVFRALIMLCAVGWMSFLLIVMCGTVFGSDVVVRRLVYRFGFAFTTLQFSGAMVFVYSVKSIFKNVGKFASNESESHEIDHAHYTHKRGGHDDSDSGVTEIQTRTVTDGPVGLSIIQTDSHDNLVSNTNRRSPTTPTPQHTYHHTQHHRMRKSSQPPLPLFSPRSDSMPMQSSPSSFIDDLDRYVAQYEHEIAQMQYTTNHHHQTYQDSRHYQ